MPLCSHQVQNCAMALEYARPVFLLRISHDVLGRRVFIDHQPFTIVGVMPPDVEYPRHVGVWMTVAAMQTTNRRSAWYRHAAAATAPSRRPTPR